MAFDDIQDLFDLVDARLADNKTRNITPFKHREVVYAVINQFKDCNCSTYFEVDVPSASILNIDSAEIEILPALTNSQFYWIQSIWAAPVGGTVDYTGDVVGEIAYSSDSSWLMRVNFGGTGVWGGPASQTLGTQMADTYSAMRNNSIVLRNQGAAIATGDRDWKVWGIYTKLTQ